MTALHLNLDAQLGPDHHFHVVPSIGEYLLSSLRVVSEARRGPAECLSLGLVAPATLADILMLAWPLARSPWYSPVHSPSRPTDVCLTLCTLSLCPLSSLTTFKDVARVVFQRFILVPFPSRLALSPSLPCLTTHIAPAHSVSSHPTSCCPVPSFPLPAASCPLFCLWYTLAPPSHSLFSPPRVPIHADPTH